MAVQYRQDRKKWRVYWKNPLSKKIESKLFSEEHEARKYDSIIKHRLHFERESFFRDDESQQQDNDSLTLEQAHFLYLREKQFDDKGLDWQRDCMARIHGMIGSMPITEIDEAVLEKVKNMELSADIKPVSARAHLSVLRTVLRWCHRKRYISTMPVFPEMPVCHYEKIQPPTHEEIARILSVAPPHLQRVILISCQMGIRVGQSELFGIRWRDVDFETAILRLWAAKKNPDEPFRDIPIRQSLLDAMLIWHDEDASKGIEYVINYHGKQIKKIETSWRNALKAAGITRRIRPYDQRHMFGSEAIAAGVDIGTVARLMGHSSPLILLKHYQHVADKQKVAAVNAIPEIKLSMPNLVCPKK